MEPCITAGTGIEETGFGYTMSLVSGKYKMIILYWLAEYSVLRYNELKRRLGTISHKTLSLSLKELEADVSYTLHISNHLHRCRNCSKVSCYRLLLHEQIKAQALYLFLLSVYLRIALHDSFGAIGILMYKCLDCFLD